MKASVRWLNQYVQPGDFTAAQIEQLLTFAGFPVEGIEPLPDGDARLDVELTSNRGDCLSHIGLARELAAAGKRKFVPPPVADAAREGSATGEQVTLENADHGACPLFTLRVIRGVKVGPSPEWLRGAIEAAGQRSINNVVDVTNYVLLEMGQPSHVFDLAKVGAGPGGVPGIVIRSARAGEKLTLLDGKAVELRPGEIVVADPQRPLSLAGIMGGAESAVSDATTDVLLEVATWNPVLVRKAARRLNIRTDSSHRYERWVPPETMAAASDRLVELIVKVAGGEVAPGVVSAGRPEEPARRIVLRAERCRAVIGSGVSDEQMSAALAAQGFEPASSGGGFICMVPHYRPDVRLEIDLIEEVARTIGYEAVPLLATLPVAASAPQTSEAAVRELGRVLTGAGFFEAVTFSFTSAKLAKPFLASGLALTNVSEDRRGSENICRPSVLCGLLGSRRANQDAKVVAPAGVRLYEIASAFAQRPPETGAPKGTPPTTVETPNLALLVDVPATGPGGGSLTALQRRQQGFALLRGAIEAVADALLGARSRLAIEPASAPPTKAYDAAACAVVTLDGKPLGVMGLIAADVQRLFELEGPVAAAELDLPLLLGAYPPRITVRALPTFPATDRDLSVIVDEGVRWSQIDRGVRATAMPNLEEFRFVTTYRGQPLKAGTKSVTLRMTFRDAERTLRDDEVNQQVGTLVERLGKEVGAVVRVG